MQLISFMKKPHFANKSTLFFIKNNVKTNFLFWDWFERVFKILYMMHLVYKMFYVNISKVHISMVCMYFIENQFITIHLYGKI